MITASNTWLDIQKRLILPESFLEITCDVTQNGWQDGATVTPVVGAEAPFSNKENLLVDSATVTLRRYATLEHNLWRLNGTTCILPADGATDNVGYVSEEDDSFILDVALGSVITDTTPGITITWSSEYGDYPTQFGLQAMNGNIEVSSRTVEDNDSNVSAIEWEISNFDKIRIAVYDWCLPNRRKRVDKIMLGVQLTFNKQDILSYRHSQYGCVNSGELPKNSISFSVSNVDGRWNPSNPTGMEKYLSERQKITVRYGLDIGGTTEWIKAGTFYLSDWRASSNGIEASFEARDVFEFLVNEEYNGITTGTLRELIEAAFNVTDMPRGVLGTLDSSLDNYTATLTEPYKAAEVIQMCANAACCTIYPTRDGQVDIKPRVASWSGYVIEATYSYLHPEVTLSKPLKKVSVSYRGSEAPYELSVGNTGETQTVSNPIVETEAQATDIASWVKDSLLTRRTVSGEFRADPRLDLFDVVRVESKYGIISPVVLNEITYTYTGSFMATYSGRVIAGAAGAAILGQFILGESMLGQEV